MSLPQPGLLYHGQHPGFVSSAPAAENSLLPSWPSCYLHGQSLAGFKHQEAQGRHKMSTVPENWLQGHHAGVLFTQGLEEQRCIEWLLY